MHVFKNTYTPIIQKENKNHSVGFLIYGVDLAPDVNLNSKIMEINKGPDLSYKDERDMGVKYNMMEQACILAGLLKTKKPYLSTFIKI